MGNHTSHPQRHISQWLAAVPILTQRSRPHGTLAPGATPMRAAAVPARVSSPTRSAPTGSVPWPPSSTRASGTSYAALEWAIERNEFLNSKQGRALYGDEE